MAAARCAGCNFLAEVSCCGIDMDEVLTRSEIYPLQQFISDPKKVKEAFPDGK